MQDALRKLTLVLLILVAFIPTINVFPWFTPPAWGQAILLRILVPLLGVLFLTRLASTPGFLQQAITRIKATKWVLSSFALFLGVYLLATLLSQDLHFSFWGDPPRAWGALNYGLYIILGFIAFLSLKKEEWNMVWGAVFGGAMFLALVAFVQRFALLPNLIDPTIPPHATLGNSIFLGAYLVPLVFLLLGFALRLINIHRSKAIGIAAIATLLLLVIFFTESRSALLGLSAGTLFFLLFSPFKAKLFRWLSIGLVIAGALMFIFLLFNPAPPSFLNEDLTRYWDKFTPRGLMQTERFAGWEIELKGIADRPLLGYGPYNSFIGFNKHFEQSFAIEYNSTGWWNTAHNMYLDIAANTGLLSLVFFLAFLGVLFWALTKTRRAVLGKEKVLIHGVQATLIAYLVAMIPAFNSTATYLVFFLLLAYALYLISIHQPKSASINVPPYLNRLSTFSPYITGVLAIFLLFFLYTAAIKPLVVQKEINIAVQESQAGRCQDALQRMERSFPKNSHFADYHRLVEVEIIGQCIGKTSQSIVSLSQKAVELERARTQQRPLLPRTWILLGGYLNNLILFSQDEQEREQFAKEAVTAFQHAQELSPNRGIIYGEWANTKRLIGEYEEGEELADRCLKLQDLGQCLWQKILTRIASGASSPSLKEVLNQAKEAEAISYQTESFYVQLVQAYTIHKEQHYPQLRDVYERLVGLNPDNIRYHAALATVYRELGERDKAIQQLNHMWRLQPTPEMQQQINAFLQTLS